MQSEAVQKAKSELDAMVDRKAIVAELRGDRCRCGSTKARGQTFCRTCYFLIPPSTRKRLYERIGEGYEGAYRDCCEYLDEKGKAKP